MEQRQEGKYDMFVRVAELALRNCIPEQERPPLLAKIAAALEETITVIWKHRGDQHHGYHKGNSPSVVQDRCDRLRSHYMKPLVRTCKRLFRYAPGIESMMFIPHKRTKPSDIADHVNAVGKVLRPHQQLLTEAGFTVAFMTAFRREGRELAAATKSRKTAGKRRSKATTGLERAFAEGMIQVDTIGGMMLPFFKKYHPLEGEWRIARKIHKRMGRPPGSSNDDPGDQTPPA